MSESIKKKLQILMKLVKEFVLPKSKQRSVNYTEIFSVNAFCCNDGPYTMEHWNSALKEVGKACKEQILKNKLVFERETLLQEENFG